MHKSNDNAINVLCIGPKGSGKTMLLKKLQNDESIDTTYNSVPTNGTNIYEINYLSKAERKSKMLIREIGGEMSSLWNSYFDGIQKLIFVVDTSNLCQISAAAVLLYTALADPKLRKAKFLLVLTKMDVAYRQMRNEALLMLQFKRLVKESPQQISVLEASAIDGDGIDKLKGWVTGIKLKTDT